MVEERAVLEEAAEEVVMGVCKSERVYVGRVEKKGARAWVVVLADGLVCVYLSLRRVGGEGRMKQRCDGERQGSAGR